MCMHDSNHDPNPNRIKDVGFAYEDSTGQTVPQTERKDGKTWRQNTHAHICALREQTKKNFSPVVEETLAASPTPACSPTPCCEPYPSLFLNSMLHVILPPAPTLT